MALKLYYKTKEEIPEGLEVHYKELDDGRWMLQGEGIEDVSGLKSALATEREDRKKAQAAVKKFSDAGIEDPAAAAEALKRVEELEGLDPEKDAEKIAAEKMKAREAQLMTKHKEDLEAKDKELSATMSQLEEVMIIADAAQAIAEHKGSVPLLMPAIKSKTRLSQENGKFVVEVLDDSGNPRIGDSGGKPMTISQFVSELKEDETFGRAFDGEGRSGSGGPGEGGGGGPIKGKGTVSAGDQDAINQNLEGIASGEVTVTE